MSMRSDQSARQLEQEADATRRRLSATLDDLADNLTPGRMLDEVIAYSRGGGASFLKGLGNAASHNPLPTLLLGVGAAMFLSGKGRVDSIPRTFSDLFAGGRANRHDAKETFERERVDNEHSSVVARAGGAVKGAAHSVASGVKSAAGSVASTAAHAADKISEQATNAASVVSETAMSVGGGVAELAESTVNTTTEEAAHLRDQAMRLSHDMRDRATRLAEEQPLIVAAAGIALGALVAALLPRTSVEDELMGETSDTIKDAAGGVVSEQIETVSSEVGKVAEEITTTVSEHGFTAKAAVDAVRNVGEKVSQAVAGTDVGKGRGRPKT